MTGRDETMHRVARGVQVNVPYRMLMDEGDLFDLFLSLNLNPELGMDIPALERFASDHFAKTAETFRRAGARITLHGPFEGVDPGAADAALRERSRGHLRRLRHAVAVMKPDSVVCHTGFHPQRPAAGFPDWLARSREAWAESAAAMADLGSRLLLENVHERSPAEMARIAGGIAHLGLCLDTGHLNAYGDGDLAGWVEALGAVTEEVHLHDNHGAVDEHLPPGRGAIDYAPLFALARRRPLIITLEPHAPEELWPALDFLARHPGLLPGHGEALRSPDPT